MTIPEKEIPVKNKVIIWITILLALSLLPACSSSATPSASPSSTPTPSPTPTASLSQYQLEYILLSKFPDVFWCDPDSYPVARDEQPNAIQQFPEIQANVPEFAAILEHLGMAVKSDYTDAEKLSIYQEHKKLSRAATLTPDPANGFFFDLRTGKNEGLHIAGTLDTGGRIKIQTQEASFNTCPICLTKGTLIDTPDGLIPVEKLQPGMPVWTMDASGRRIAAPILKISSTPVPAGFQVVSVTLNDGRSVTASPGHPSAEKRALGEYRVGDTLDRGQVIATDKLEYSGGATYDILPSGHTGLYWANGILLLSTLPPIEHQFAMD
jgi:hypothetical protein